MTIPDDVMIAANNAFLKAWDKGHCGAIADAIMAERERCAKVAEDEAAAWHQAELASNPGNIPSYRAFSGTACERVAYLIRRGGA